MENTLQVPTLDGAKGRPGYRDSEVPAKPKRRSAALAPRTDRVEPDLSEVFRLLQIRWIAADYGPCTSESSTI